MVKSQRVIDAMKATDRACYVRRPADAYEDSPQTIGHGATISAPHMVRGSCSTCSFVSGLIICSM